MRRLLPLLFLVPSLALGAIPEEAPPRKYAVPLGPYPVGHQHDPIEPHGDVYKALGVPTVAMASQVQMLPHAQDAGVRAFIRELESTTFWAGAVRPRITHSVVVERADGSTVPLLDHPEGWRTALGAWSRTRNTSFAAAWALAGMHLNACIDLDRYDPPDSVDRIYRADQTAPHARIDIGDDGSATLQYSWWTRTGRPTLIDVPLDDRSPCPAELRRR